MPVPTYISPQSPATGTVLGATHENLWVRAIEYLHGYATGGYHPFSGNQGRTGSPWGFSGEVEVYRGYYVYEGGPKYIYNKIVCIGENVNIYISRDGAEVLVQTLTSPGNATSPIDLTAYTFTVGTKYYLRVTVVNTATPSRGEARVDWAYVLGANAGSLAWVTPTTFTDGNVSANTDLSNLTSNCEYLNTILAQRRASFRAQSGAAPLGSSSLIIWNGTFIYKGLNTLETAITHTPSSSVASIHIIDTNEANNRTVGSIISTDTAFATSYDIGSLSPALVIGTRYRMYVEENIPSGPTRGGVHVNRIYISGTKSLTNIPKRWNPGDYGYGSSGANREAYIAQSLTDIRAVSEYDTVAGVDYGRQYLSQNNIDIHDDDVTVTTRFFQDFKFSRGLRFLMYLPTAAGASGTLTYGDATESLPDINGDGSWTGFDLETVKLLPLGFTYKVTGVKACIESASG